VHIRWEMMPLVFMGVVIVLGIRRYDRATQPPPVGREFYRPHWEWERTDPLGRRLRVAKYWIGLILATSVTCVFFLAFVGIDLPIR
jgi:hypothetical protein